MAGKLTIDLAPHWPCIADLHLCLSSLQAQWPSEGDERAACTVQGSWSALPELYISLTQCHIHYQRLLDLILAMLPCQLRFCNLHRAHFLTQTAPVCGDFVRC